MTELSCPSCSSHCSEGDSCTQWDVIFPLGAPGSSSRKQYFEALVYSSWAVLAITA